VLWVGAYKDFECAAFYFFRLLWVDEVASGQDQWTRREDFSLPAVREAAVKKRCGKIQGHG
jgi:hypothetical protein